MCEQGLPEHHRGGRDGEEDPEQRGAVAPVDQGEWQRDRDLEVDHREDRAEYEHGQQSRVRPGVDLCLIGRQLSVGAGQEYRDNHRAGQAGRGVGDE